MKVKKFIEQLQSFDPEMEVVIRTADDYMENYEEPDIITRELIRKYPCSEWEEYREGDSEEYMPEKKNYSEEQLKSFFLAWYKTLQGFEEYLDRYLNSTEEPFRRPRKTVVVIR